MSRLSPSQRRRIAELTAAGLTLASATNLVLYYGTAATSGGGK